MYSIPKRKIKAYLKSALLVLGIFCLTFLTCFLVSWFFLFKNHTISPLQTLKNILSDDEKISQIHSFCQTNHVNCTQVFENDSVITVTLDTGSIIYFSTKKDISRQLASLQVALSQLTIKGKQFKTLDFRFANGIATF